MKPLRTREVARLRKSDHHHPAAHPSSGTDSPAIGGTRRRVEQGVDEILHLKIAQSVIDCDTPSTIVLASGDAAEAEYSDGFLKMLERALRKGWKVELVAFKSNVSSAYRKEAWRRQWQASFSIIELDEFAENLALMTD